MLITKQLCDCKKKINYLCILRIAFLCAQFPKLKDYTDYCANQVYAKSLLDAKKHDKKVEDFLQRCIESPFSRKLDLWSFLGNNSFANF